MHLVFWQPIPSFHQEGFLAALAQADWVDSVTLKYEEELPESRRRSGWRDLALQGVILERIQPLEIPVNSEDYVHIFTGFQTHRQIWEAFNRLPSQAPCRRFAFAEAPECIGWQGWLRKIKYKVVSWQIAPRLDGMLALGQLGVDFYRSILPPSVPLYQFAYYDAHDFDVHALNSLDSYNNQSPTAPYRFLYVGQLIHRKGVDRLLRALAALSSGEWTLDLVGEGSEQCALQKLGSTLGISEKLVWHGSLPSRELASYYQSADSVVLPSRWDGWGMIVNEALRFGCDVLATVTCGAASVLPPSAQLPKDTRNWTTVLAKRIHAGRLTRSARRENQSIACFLTGKIGAEKLRAILAS